MWVDIYEGFLPTKFWASRSRDLGPGLPQINFLPFFACHSSKMNEPRKLKYLSKDGPIQVLCNPKTLEPMLWDMATGFYLADLNFNFVTP